MRLIPVAKSSITAQPKPLPLSAIYTAFGLMVPESNRSAPKQGATILTFLLTPSFTSTGGQVLKPRPVLPFAGWMGEIIRMLEENNAVSEFTQ
jgi:hypothetical protein